MEISQAADMLNHSDFNALDKKVWADLGCGTGTFTMALATKLPPKSIIYAMDSNNFALKTIPDRYENVIIKKIQGNFVTDHLPFSDLDGILMANSIHYVKDKVPFIQKASKHLASKGYFLLVEYDTDIPNNWVPYPQTFSSLGKLFSGLGFSTVKKLR